MDKKIDTFIQGHIQFFEFLDRLTYDTISEFKDEMFDLILPAKGYILDLRKVAWIDSAGIGLLVTLLNRIKASQRNVSVLTRNDVLSKLLHLSKLDELFYMTDDLNDAIANINNMIEK